MAFAIARRSHRARVLFHAHRSLRRKWSASTPDLTAASIGAPVAAPSTGHETTSSTTLRAALDMPEPTFTIIMGLKIRPAALLVASARKLPRSNVKDYAH